MSRDEDRVGLQARAEDRVALQARAGDRLLVATKRSPMLVIHNSNIFIDTSIRLDSVPVPHCLVLNGVRPQLLLPVSSTLHGPAKWHWVWCKRQPLKRVPMRMLVPVPFFTSLSSTRTDRLQVQSN